MSTLTLKQRGALKTQRTTAFGVVVSSENTVSSLQLSSSNGAVDPTSTWMLVRKRSKTSSRWLSLGNRARTFSSDAVDVTRNGAASAKRIRCGWKCSPAARIVNGRRCLGIYAAPGISRLPEPEMNSSLAGMSRCLLKNSAGPSPMSTHEASVPKMLT